METLRAVLGLGVEPKDLGVLQVCLRGIIVFIAALVMLRVGHKRFLSRMTAFDVVLGFILASALARAINGSAPFLPTLVVGFVLVFLHRVLAALTFHSEKLGNLIKGHSNELVKQGKLQEQTMRQHKITKNDILEAARLRSELNDLKEIKTATLERSGEISVIPAKED